MSHNILLRFLKDPTTATQFTASEWDLLIRLARHSKLLSHMGFLLAELDLKAHCPRKALDNMQGAKAYSDFYQTQANWELRQLQNALAETKSPILLLKGAAYLVAQLPPNRGRLLSDVDILVPHNKLTEVEQCLNGQGWLSETQDEYDQRYYRDWMHEIPPLRHKNRGVEVDIHHNLLPLAGSLQPNAELLWQVAQPIEKSNFLMLCPTDMVLHSASHLFFSDELRGGIRDLVDIHQLCQHFSQQDSDFWDRLTARSEEMDLSRPLYYALNATHQLLETPVPMQTLKAVNHDAPGLIADKIMQRLITQVLEPHLPDNPAANFAQRLLYLRSHWVRMPLQMLLPHLFHKAFLSPRKKNTTRSLETV
ncbi:MAG: nucleotidyltransferase family protein [Candidatus Polarisedimenticolaceae bacterium]|nr:nucleotidyltransferase family protein [Candidatus Polarisedimenticolaceae bacterium]